jgi:hypothetical protein
LRALTCEVSNIYSSANLWGNWNVVSNEDDGKVFLSDTGKIIELFEDGGPAQYPTAQPADPNDIVSEPATGPVWVRTSATPSDTLTADVSIDLSKDLDITLLVRTIANPNSGDRYIELYDSTDVNKYMIIYWFTGGALAVAVENGGGTLSAVPSTISEGDLNTVGVRMTGPQNAKSFVACVDGVEDASPAGVDMSGMNLDRLVIGSRRAGATLMDMDLHWLSSNQLGYVNFVSRLWTENDTNGGKFFGTATTENPTGIELLLTDNPELGAMFPHLFKNGQPAVWPTTYLISDTPCSGSALLLDDDSIALQDDEGEFLFGD